MLSHRGKLYLWKSMALSLAIIMLLSFMMPGFLGLADDEGNEPAEEESVSAGPSDDPTPEPSGEPSTQPPEGNTGGDTNEPPPSGEGSTEPSNEAGDEQSAGTGGETSTGEVSGPQDVGDGTQTEENDDNYLQQNFGGSISGFIWADGNGTLTSHWDGIYNTDEKGIAGYNVYLYNAADLAAFKALEEQDRIYENMPLPVTSTTTNHEGVYIFTGLLPGNYIVGLASETLSGVTYLLPLAKAGISVFDVDYETVPNLALSETFIITNNEMIADIHAGLRLPMDIVETSDVTMTNVGDSSISGFIWCDGNGMIPTDWNGMYDSGELSLRGIIVYLYDADAISGPITAKTAPIDMAVSDSNGIYIFENLAPGNYILGIVNNIVGTTEYVLPFDRTSDNKFEIDYDVIDWDTWDDETDMLIATTVVIELQEQQSVTDINAGMRLPMGIEATALEDDIKNATLFTGIVHIDGWDWRVVKKETISGVEYAMLMKATSVPNISLPFNPLGSSSATATNYSGSSLQSRMTGYYTSYYGRTTIKFMAVVPNLGAHNSTASRSLPTAVPAGEQIVDIMFAQSYGDLFEIIGGTGPFPAWLNSYTSQTNARPFWLRTAQITIDTNVYTLRPNVYDGTVGPGTISLGAHYASEGTSGPLDIPAVWVRVSAQEHIVTVHYVDENGLPIGSPTTKTYTVPNGGTFTLPSSEIQSILGYTFANEWRVETGSWQSSPPISVPNVTGPLNVYLKYIASTPTRERYLVSHGSELLSTWRWLADAVHACVTGPEESYVITATENDDDVTDYLNRATAAGGTWQNFINATPTSGILYPAPINIPANKQILLRSDTGVWTITNRTYSRHLNVDTLGTLTLENIILEGMGYSSGPAGSVNGGVSVAYNGTLAMFIGSVITKCMNTQDGGAVTVSSGGRLAMLGYPTPTIYNNISNSNGGGVHVNSGGYFNMTNGTISGNTASGNGGGVSNNGQLLIYNILGGTINNNTAGQNGGGVSNGGQLEIYSGTISNNTATNGNGGGVYTTNSLSTTGGSIVSNSANNGNGGGIFTTDYANLQISTTTVFGRWGTSSANTASSSSDYWPTQAAFIARFQTPYTSPTGIYSPWGQNYSTTANHPVNNYDINVITHTVLVMYMDKTTGVPINTGPPDNVTFRLYQVPNGTTFALDGTGDRIVPTIPGYTFIDWLIFPGLPQGNTNVVVNNVTDYMIIHLLYEEEAQATTTLTVSKLVAGPYALRDKIWPFTVYFANDAGTPLPSGTVFNYTLTTPSQPDQTGTITLNSGGSATFNLKHGQKIVFDGVPLDARIRIVETPDANYIASYKDSTYPTPVADHDTGGSGNPTPVMLQMSDDRRFDFLNTMRTVTEAGVGTNAVYLFGLSMFAGSAGLTYLPAHMIMRMRRGRRWDDMIRSHMEYQAYLAKDDWDG